MIHGCAICCCMVFAPGEPSWSNQFRGLYRGPEGLVLTGVGLYDDPHLLPTAPPDTNARWDDPGYERDAKDAFGAFGGRPWKGRHGFLFHDACWSLLRIVAPRQDVDLARLYQVCDSLPYPLEGNTLSWGDDMGGTTVIDNGNHFPWQDRFMFPPTVKPQLANMTDPYDVPTARRLLGVAPQSSPDASCHASDNVNAKTPADDCFHSLSLELCSAIAAYLSTPDFLNLRLASRSFVPVFHSQQFWASRFRGRGERAWLFEAIQQGAPQAAARDWRNLYRLTSDSRLNRELKDLRNRKRVWGLALRAMDIVSLDWYDNTPSSQPHLQGHETRSFTNASGLLWELDPDGGFYQNFENGCRRFHTTRIPVPERITCLSVSSTVIGDLGFLTGIRLEDEEGQSMQVGYWGPDVQHCYARDTRGFNVGLGARGVQSIQCVYGDKTKSLWLGHPENAPKTQRLRTQQTPQELEIGFDGFKIVSLGVPDPSVHTLPPESAAADRGLSELGLWYPEIPAENLLLNEDSFTARNKVSSGYCPLLWVFFGGPAGSYLKHLTRITSISKGYLRRMDFAHDIDVPTQSRRLGKYEQPLDKAVIESFDIDGPGGEVISVIEVEQFYPMSGRLPEDGNLMSFKVRNCG